MLTQPNRGRRIVVVGLVLLLVAEPLPVPPCSDDCRAEEEISGKEEEI